ncbi:hypothetical protein [Nonomuraea aridisoli]|uniref:Uncharacterized protein n=1 Tax=Nonomuraea aridisoli TaxID=2070368 RepID=A0A2W2DV60_9ACTN|nr:hypothetical protein [Nonomuraea aridisoli]PZG15756.1 hypothetical protein C1J01_23120 [Nonomuraea aridisoli]
MSCAPSAASAVLRLSRAVVFATACGAVSAAGHALAGGGRVPLGACLAAVLAVLALAYAINGRERGPAAVLAATVVTQTALHQLFDRLAPGDVTASGHGHPAPGMALVHLTLAALTAWWLHRGESALWLMIRLYGAPRPAIRLFTALPAVAARPVPVPIVPCDARVLAGRTVSAAISRRGPPVQVA